MPILFLHQTNDTRTGKRIMWQVTVSKGNFSDVYGTYATEELANEAAASHIAGGYWTSVTIKMV